MRSSSSSSLTLSAVALLFALGLPSLNANPVTLQRRQNNGGPSIGSSEWKALYPPGLMLATPKQEWLDSLKSAVAAGLIPDVPTTRIGPTGYPVYPTGVDTTAAGVCSWTASHCFADDDIHQSEPNTYTISWDDGPTPITDTLITFLQANRLKGSHMMIGSNILANPDHLLKVVEAQQHLGIHTWSHKFLTNMTNEQVVGELGWTLQIILDLTGFVPNVYRAPDGDLDNRVRAIARNIFNLRATVWDYDSGDWRLLNGPQGAGGVNLASVNAQMKAKLSSSLSTGIFPLHHEISAAQISGFTDTFPDAKEAGYKFQSIPELANIPWYQNSQDGNNPAPGSNPGDRFTASSTSNGPTTIAVGATASTSASASASNSSTTANSTSTSNSSSASSSISASSDSVTSSTARIPTITSRAETTVDPTVTSTQSGSNNLQPIVGLIALTFAFCLLI